MSKFLKPTLYNNRGLENQIRNLCYGAHDLACGCNTPGDHLLHILQPCHGITTTKEDPITALTDAVDGLEDGDLDRLFSEDFTEDDER